MSVKDAEFGFGRLIDLARAKPISTTNHGQPVVVVLLPEENERRKALDAPETPPISETQG